MATNNDGSLTIDSVEDSQQAFQEKNRKGNKTKGEKESKSELSFSNAEFHDLVEDFESSGDDSFVVIENNSSYSHGEENDYEDAIYVSKKCIQIPFFLLFRNEGTGTRCHRI